MMWLLLPIGVISFAIYIWYINIYKKDSWKTCKVEYLEKKLVEEYKEWQDITMGCNAKDEVIDIANICMMLYHRYNSGLKEV